MMGSVYFSSCIGFERGKTTGIVAVGIDLAKNVFTLPGVDETGKVVLRKLNVKRRLPFGNLGIPTNEWGSGKRLISGADGSSQAAQAVCRNAVFCLLTGLRSASNRGRKSSKRLLEEIVCSKVVRLGGSIA